MNTATTLIVITTVLIVFLLTPKVIKKINKRWPKVRTLDDYKSLKQKRK